jgi:hypothetical protein
MIIPFRPLLVVEEVTNFLKLQPQAFGTLLRQTQNDRKEIRSELDQIFHILDEFKRR